MFEFEMRATEKDPSGYYFPRWDLSEKLIVKANTKQEALEKAEALLGETTRRRGWAWAIKVDSVTEL